MPKKIISVSLDSRTISGVDKYVGSLASTRSAVIENILENFVNSNKSCVILAGGDPKKYIVKNEYRLFSNVNGKSLIENIIKNVYSAGYVNIFFIGSKEILNLAFGILGDNYLGCSIKYIEEEKYMENANTLKVAKKFIKGTFLFVPCDHYFDFDLRKLEKVHRSNNFEVTLAIYGGKKYDNNRSAIVELDGNEIVNYWDTPKEDKSVLVSTMIGLAEPSFLEKIPDKKTNLNMDVFSKMPGKGLGGAILSGNFVNVHKTSDLDVLNRLR